MDDLLCSPEEEKIDALVDEKLSIQEKLKSASRDYRRQLKIELANVEYLLDILMDHK